MNFIDGLVAMLEQPCRNHRCKQRFLAGARYVIDGALERRALTGLPLIDREPAFLKRGAYVLIRKDLDQNSGAAIKMLTRGDRRVTSHAPSFDQNSFYLGLLAVFDDPDIMAKDRRRAWARELLYAHQHSVSEDALIGFLMQCFRDQLTDHATVS